MVSIKQALTDLIWWVELVPPARTLAHVHTVDLSPLISGEDEGSDSGGRVWDEAAPAHSVAAQAAGGVWQQTHSAAPNRSAGRGQELGTQCAFKGIV